MQYRHRSATLTGAALLLVVALAGSASAGKAAPSGSTGKRGVTAAASPAPSPAATATAPAAPATTTAPAPTSGTAPAADPVPAVQPVLAPAAPAPAQTAAAATAFARKVPTTFGVGVQAANDSKTLQGWMPRTGAPIDYAYRYLGGGLNTGGARNWTEWEPSATYPKTYATAAATRGYTPVFSYYTLLAANGACSDACGEAQRDLTNLNDPAVMALYFADFRRLMQRLGSGTYDGVTGFGGDAIVHVEPDLSGYAQNAALSSVKCFGFCSGTGNDPSLVRASVKSSGDPVAAAYPNTYTGFNAALLRIRDLYAPKVRMAMHVSNWATGYDLNSATGALDPVALGNKAGSFAAAAGAGTTDGTHTPYDLLFNDVSNKDAAYYTYVLGKPRFWDQDNAVFPNFHRWEAYVKAFTTTTARKSIVWQVPIGNQLYTPMNNTRGHWQDNRVEYFFGHVAELRDAGMVGMLFGTTQVDATTYWDAMADLVTNPAPVCNSDGWSSGKVVCSSRQSAVADDDGGYLRTSIQSYYKAPLAL